MSVELIIPDLFKKTNYLVSFQSRLDWVGFVLLSCNHWSNYKKPYSVHLLRDFSTVWFVFLQFFWLFLYCLKILPV